MYPALKYFATCSFALTIGTTKAYNNNSLEVQTSKNPHTQQDTIFLYQSTQPNYIHKVYISPDKNTEIFQKLLNFEFNSYDSVSYLQYQQLALEEYPNSSKKNYLHGLSPNWLPLYLYKGKYYLYAPSDWGTSNKQSITPQELIFWYMDGPLPLPILSVRKPSQQQYVITTFVPSDKNKLLSKTTIHIIDPKTKMAVFEYENGTNPSSYQLYIPVESAHLFDIIVNECKQGKAMEYNFETIDYKKILTLAEKQ